MEAIVTSSFMHVCLDSRESLVYSTISKARKQPAKVPGIEKSDVKHSRPARLALLAARNESNLRE
jgi:hypothetical protein